MTDFRKHGRNWYFRYTTADGRRVERKDCPDRRVTEQLAAAAEAEVAKIRAGLIDPKEDAFRRHAARPVAEHLADWRASLVVKGNVARYVQIAHSHVARLVELAKAERIGDLSPSTVQAALKALKDSGLAAQTCNHALSAVKGFTRWLCRDGRTRHDALAHLTGFNVATDRRHDRGVLTGDEFQALLRATRAERPFRRLSGDDRAMLYLVASYTGLRASELASLTPASFDLDPAGPAVRVRAGSTKNKQEAVLPLRRDLADLLASYLAGRPAGAPVWPGTWAEKGARMLRRDLEAAGVAYVDDDGRYRDFHSLRHRFGSGLAAANVPPKVAQVLMRHSTITLTMDRYAHASLHDVADALDKLPPISAESPGASAPAMEATGTDGRSISDRLSPHFPHAGDVSGRMLAGSRPQTPRSAWVASPWEIRDLAPRGGSWRQLAGVHPAGLEPATLSSEGGWTPRMNSPGSPGADSA
jgi:integrase